MNERRRRLFLLAMAGTAAGLGAGRVNARPVEAKRRAAEPRGYRLTAHVQRFYKSAGTL